LAEGEGVPPANFLEGWSQPQHKLRVGIPRAFFYDDLHPEVAKAVESALASMKPIASEIRDITLAPDNDRTVQAAESYAYHAEHVAKSPALYQPETLRRIRTGEHISKEDYSRQLGVLEKAREEIRKTFAEVDVIVTPTTPIPAPKISDLKENP